MSVTQRLRFDPICADFAPSAEMRLGANPLQRIVDGVSIPFSLRGVAENPALGSPAVWRVEVL